MKRCFDFIVCMLALVFFSPLLVIIGLYIKLKSPGPIIYWSDRIGRNNKVFSMPKFRSMFIDAPSLATDLMESIIGAIFLDSDYSTCETIVINTFKKHLDKKKNIGESLKSLSSFIEERKKIIIIPKKTNDKCLKKNV